MSAIFACTFFVVIVRSGYNHNFNEKWGTCGLWNYVDYGCFSLIPPASQLWHSRMHWISFLDLNLNRNLICMVLQRLIHSISLGGVVDKITSLRFDAIRCDKQCKREKKLNKCKKPKHHTLAWNMGMNTRCTWYANRIVNSEWLKRSCKLEIIELSWVRYGIFSIYTAITWLSMQRLQMLTVVVESVQFGK